MQQWLNITSTVIIIIILKARIYLGDGRRPTRAPPTAFDSGVIFPTLIFPRKTKTYRGHVVADARVRILRSICLSYALIFFSSVAIFSIRRRRDGRRMGAWGMLAREKSGRGKIMALRESGLGGRYLLIHTKATSRGCSARFPSIRKLFRDLRVIAEARR